MRRLTKQEVLELARRHRRTKVEGASLEEVRGDMLTDMVSELRQMVRGYSGDAQQTRDLLEAIVIAETEGVSSEALADVLGELRTKLEAA